MFAAGPGQIWSSVLSGRKRVGGSLAAQALGLVAGTAGAAAFILRGRPEAAAMAFASGGLVTAAATFVLAARLGIPRVPLKTAMGEARTLLRYSAALAATTSFYAIVLFVLRLVYRDAFGATQLGYWLAANRISDMSTQLVGLFLVQVFVPHLTTTSTEAARRAVIARCAAIGAAGMGAILLTFSLAPGLWVRLFLSDAFLPAVPSIQIYMLGDTLRVLPSLAMFAAFAQGRPARFAAIDMGSPAVMAAITVALIGFGLPLAPPLGYVAAYAMAAAATVFVFLGRKRVAATVA
jgi:O-antigen/teichoic acid export membrane protein